MKITFIFLQPWMPFEDMEKNKWICVKYEGSLYIGIVVDISEVARCAKVRCLEKPYTHGLSATTSLEPENIAVWYSEDKLFEAPVIPQYIKSTVSKRGWKYQF